MVLSDSQIKKEIGEGNIILSPFNEDLLNPNSVDLTLASKCKVYRPEALSMAPKSLVDKYYPQLCEWANKVESVEDWYLDTKEKNPDSFEIELNEEGLILQPNHLYLYSCQETIGAKNNICGTVLGKSSLGRLGLDIHVCAGFLDTNFVGSLVLEMRCIYPIKVYPGMKICQIKFERVEGEVEVGYDKKPGSKYMNQVGVQESKYNQNFPIRTLE